MLQGILVEDTVSNLTSVTSKEASFNISSGNNRNKLADDDDAYTLQQPHHPQINDQFFFPSPPCNNDSLLPDQPPANKKKRSLPGNPDPEAEVVALSPKSLMATNRFLCEICNKGFQRDQNLQLHRRGHNLPWKLKQRSKTEVVKKKVYICPEPSCVHHEPSRALGDLTGIKKHYFRKHGEKKFKCDKCSKRYAVHSDWKAHSKICGTREYRCDCGTLFSRRDSFITHRAFCDALAEESSRTMTTRQQIPLFSAAAQNQKDPHHQIFFNSNELQLKQETFAHNFNNLPPWISSSDHDINQQFVQENPNRDSVDNPQPLLSATAILLRRAAQMGGGAMNNNDSDNKTALHHSSDDDVVVHRHSPYLHVGNNSQQCLGSSDNITVGAGLSSSSPREVFLHGLASSLGNDAVVSAGLGNKDHLPSLIFEDNGFKNGILINNPNKRKGSNNEGQTRDFLGLRAFPNERREFIYFTNGNLDQMGSSSSSSSYDHHMQSGSQHQVPWQN